MSRDVEFDPGTSPCPPTYAEYRSTQRMAIDATALEIAGRIMDAGGEGVVMLGGYKITVGKLTPVRDYRDDRDDD